MRHTPGTRLNQGLPWGQLRTGVSPQCASVPGIRRGGLEPARPHKPGPARSNRAPATTSGRGCRRAPGCDVSQHVTKRD